MFTETAKISLSGRRVSFEDFDCYVSKIEDGFFMNEKFLIYEKYRTEQHNFYMQNTFLFTVRSKLMIKGVYFSDLVSGRNF